MRLHRDLRQVWAVEMSACRTKEETAEAKAHLARQAKQEAAVRAKKAAHDAAVRANTAGRVKSQQQYTAELRSLDREIALIRQKLHKRITKVRVSYVLSALVGLGFWVVALIILVKTPAKPVSIFPFGFGLAFLCPLITSTKGAAATSKAANLASSRDSMLQALGCGKDCEYGCRKY